MTRYLLDCDPGHDDAVAILFAARHLDLVGITTTHGNSSLDNTTRNALAICELGGLDLPVARGAAAPLEGTAVSGAIAHGKSGLDGVTLPPPTRALHRLDAVDFLCAEAARAPGDLVVIATGPLTNLAQALAREPRLREWLRGISVMGGSTAGGNITPAAEFNIYSDPEAAARVFASGIPLHMVGLNVTHQVGITGADIDDLQARGGLPARQLAGALRYYLERQGSLYGRTIAPMHDVCACLPFTHPGLIDYRPTRVEIETQGRYTRGMTICDLRGVIATETGNMTPSGAANALVAVAAQGREIVRTVVDTLISYR